MAPFDRPHKPTFLLMFYSNYGSILHRFRNIQRWITAFSWILDYVQDHWKRHQLVNHNTTSYQSAVVTIILSFIIFELLDVENNAYRDLEN